MTDKKATINQKLGVHYVNLLTFSSLKRNVRHFNLYPIYMKCNCKKVRPGNEHRALTPNTEGSFLRCISHHENFYSTNRNVRSDG